MNPTPLKLTEVLDCLRDGWRLQFVPRSVSGRHEAMFDGLEDVEGETRDLWLNDICADDHPDREMEWAALCLWESDDIRCLEVDDTKIGVFMLTELAPQQAERFAVEGVSW